MSQQHLFWDNLMATTPHSMYVNAEDCYLSSGVVSDGALEMDKRERRRRTAVTTIYMPMERVFQIRCGVCWEIIPGAMMGNKLSPELKPSLIIITKTRDPPPLHEDGTGGSLTIGQICYQLIDIDSGYGQCCGEVRTMLG